MRGAEDTTQAFEVKHWLSGPRTPRVIVALALLCALPSLATPFFSDDFILFGYLEKRFAYDPAWWDLYHFTPDGPDAIRRLIEAGEGPWWTSPDLHFRFVRPLPSALLALDHAIFGHGSVGWHVHSLLWYAALLTAVGALFRRVLSPATAALALLLFALSDANVFPFAWPAARYGLVAGVFSALGILATVRFRRDGWRPGRWLAPLAFAVGLLGGESALGAFAFAIAYEVVGPDGRASPLRSRFARTLPLIGMVVAYLALYAAMGGGARGSGGYVSPLSDPLRFVQATLTRLPVLLGDAVLGVPAELANLGLQGTLAIVGLVATVFFVLLSRACAPLVPHEERRTLRWLALGGLAALLPCVGGFPGARELLIANIGFAALVAAVLRYGFAPGPLAFARRAGAGLLFLVHVALAPLGQIVNQASMRTMSRATRDAAHAILREAGGSPRIFMVAASDLMTTVYAQAVVATETREPLGCWGWLSAVRSDVTLARTGPASFTIEPRTGSFMRTAFETLYRGPTPPFHVGSEWLVCGARVRVASVERDLPVRVEVSSDIALEAPGAAWLAWQAGSVKRVTFPAIGQTSIIPWTPGPSGFF